jgi:oligopeptide/dipeptide ABC transporter ATP-binding protein
MRIPLLEIVGLKKEYFLTDNLLDRFSKKPKVLHAINDLNLIIYRGETLGLVGESGCGKSTLGKIILSIEKPTKGFIKWKGKKISELTKKSEIKQLRKEMQIVFQNPATSLDRRMTAKQILAEPFQIHYKLRKKELEQKIIELLRMVGLNPTDAEKYSGAFSDGQKQRIALIRALSLNPEFIVADEPVSALDVSVQAQILNLMKQLQKEMHLTMLFISHDLQVVRFISDRIAVIYLGKIVELGPSEEVFINHYHPYTEGLIFSFLDINPGINSNQFKLKADTPMSQINIPSGCIFHLRCADAIEQCKSIKPELKEISKHHFVACIKR